MMKVLVVSLSIFVVLVVAANGQSKSNLLKEEWEAFKLQHSKTYLNKVEEGFRFKIYLENRLRIAKHNKNPEKRFKLGMNKYGDLLQQEFSAMMNGYRMDLKRNDTGEGKILFLVPENNGELPQSLDWRDEGFVTPIKDQGQCGSCWSFSATGALEGQQKRKAGVLVSLSEQNLVDCSTVDGNNGCEGGIMDYAYRYIKENNGIDTEESYPYEAKDDQCRFTSANVGADDEGYVDIPEGNEEALMEAVATVGPISVAIDASHETFQLYESGIYFEWSCSSTELDHAVLVIGYGSESGVDYWLVKNSWGVGWGDGGYIKMARNFGNNCGIATMASYPIV